MNELKFRAKANIDNEWKYASNIHKVILDDTYEELWVIHPKGEKIEHLGDGYIKYRPLVVDKETIGQYTGLKDKNGKEIYVGDILIDRECNQSYIISNLYEFHILFKNYIEREETTLMHIRVGGHIHENKELLNG